MSKIRAAQSFSRCLAGTKYSEYHDRVIVLLRNEPYVRFCGIGDATTTLATAAPTATKRDVIHTTVARATSSATMDIASMLTDGFVTTIMTVATTRTNHPIYATVSILISLTCFSTFLYFSSYTT